MDRFNRRRFLQCAAAGGLSYAFGRTPQAVAAGAFAGQAGFADYKALVCVFLFGGNDSFNMVVPRSNAEYNLYAASRQNLAIAQTSLLPIVPLTPDPGGVLSPRQLLLSQRIQARLEREPKAFDGLERPSTAAGLAAYADALERILAER